MNNPPALRAQTTPPATAPPVQPYLIFLIDAQPYACPVEQVERLLRLADVPVQPPALEAPGWEVGRLKLDDEAQGIPILCLRTLWGLPPLEEETQRLRRALLVVRLAGHEYALQVDACLSVISGLPPESGRFRLPGALKGTRGAAFQSATPWKQSLLVILEIQELLTAVAARPLPVAPVAP